MSTLQTFADLGGIKLNCPDAFPTVLGILDPSIAPHFLYYSYIPIIVIALLFGYFVLIVSREALAGRLLLWITIVFSILLSSEIFLWIAVSAPLVHFVWQTIIIFHAILAFLLVYFTYAFITGEDMPSRLQWLILIPLLPIFILAPTILNLRAFDLANCESIQGPLWLYMYVIELGALMTAFSLCIRKSKQTRDCQECKKALILGVGILVFFGIYILANVLGDVTLFYNINLIGPIGMVAFLGTIAYLIVRYHAFNMRVLGAQILVGALASIVFAALFVRKIEDVRYVLIGSLILVVSVGVALVRGVKREIRQREEIEKLAQNLAIANKELEAANKGQENLIHIINHQIKGYLSTARNVFAELLQTDDYGQMPEASKPLLAKGLEEMGEGVDYVQEILRSSSAQSGTLSYDMKQVDLKALVSCLVAKQKEVAQAAGLSFGSNIADGDYAVTGDAIMLEETFKNLITNAIKYNNPNGSVAVSLSHSDGKILFAVKDTGRGISKEDEPRLFKPGGMGKDSMKYNVSASGYGLAFVKPVVEKHHGRVWYDTKVGVGTTFFVELPIL
ncbi:MAG: ATP-binding protein [Candidatus Paceibacterota bacterium]|jgi:signal transduction histidine kinase